MLTALYAALVLACPVALAEREGVGAGLAPGGAFVEEVATRPAFADFRPSRHGFAFVNSFRGSPLPVSVRGIERRLRVPERFGLCGGMCFAAADFYLAGRDLLSEIQEREPPENGSALYRYLYARQAASLGPMASMFTKFVEWMELEEGGADGSHARSVAELALMLPAIDAGEPVVLGLVLAGRGQEVWRNHQVLIYGVADGGDEGGTPALRIYDPNYPLRDDVVIRWVSDDDDGRFERQVPGRTPTRVRGFFRMPYVPAAPPASIAEEAGDDRCSGEARGTE
jgi:hypothetical protein